MSLVSSHTSVFCPAPPGRSVPTPPLAGRECSVHYHGMLEDGTVFDSSVKRDTPFNFTVGEGVIQVGGALSSRPPEGDQSSRPPVSASPLRPLPAPGALLRVRCRGGATRCRR